MRYVTIAATLGLFTFAAPVTASAQVNNCNNGNIAVTTAVGAVLGGTTVGIIAGNSKGFRSSRGFSRRGFRNRGFSRRGFRRNNQGVGIVLGALAGGIVANQIATAKNRDCFQKQTFKSSQSLSGGPIDHNARRLGDPYGGRIITDQTQSQRQIAQPANQPQGLFQPICENFERTTNLPDGRVISEPVEYCQFSPGGEWIQR